MNCTLLSDPPRTASRGGIFRWPALRFDVKLRQQPTYSVAARRGNRRNRIQISSVDTRVKPAQSLGFAAAPRWIDWLFFALVIYVVTGSVGMLTGVGGPVVTHCVGLFS